MKTRSTNHLLIVSNLFGLFVVAVLLWGSPTPAVGGPRLDSPRSCRRCHDEAYDMWLQSGHNTDAYAGAAFQEAWDRSRQREECLACHTTGYDTETGTMEFEGVGCTACHPIIEAETHDYSAEAETRDHSERSVPGTSRDCEACHGNDHARTFVEWDASSHNGLREVGCYACHTAHSGGLLAEDVTTLCGSCHLTPVPTSNPHMHVDSGCTDCHPAPVNTENLHMHGGEDGTSAACDECHMVIEMDDWDRYQVNAGHSMEVSLLACQNCHGLLHDMQPAPEPVEPGSLTTISQ